ncbi:MAG: hypothetical protein J6X35_09085 [Bacteroidales bacterium]|nr:hypothetical protein [Bacteroidales bacterium]
MLPFAKLLSEQLNGVPVSLTNDASAAAVDAIEAAVLAGDIPETRIDESVRRILALK